MTIRRHGHADGWIVGERPSLSVEVWLGQGKLSLSICWCWCVWFIECIGSTQTFHSMSWLCCLGRELNNYVIDRKPGVVMPGIIMAGFGICGLVYYITFGDGWSSWVINSSLSEAESVWQTWFTVVKIKRISLYRKILPDREEEILNRFLINNLYSKNFRISVFNLKLLPS